MKFFNNNKEKLNTNSNIFETSLIYHNKKSIFRILFIISLILFTFMLISTVVFYIKKNNEEIKYEVVKCTVLSTNKEVKKFLGNIYFETTVFVSYQGTKYKLIGAENKYYNYIYPKNKVVDVYLSNNKLFADQMAIRNDLKTTKIYFVFLILSGIVGVFLLTSIICYKREINKSKVKRR